MFTAPQHRGAAARRRATRIALAAVLASIGGFVVVGSASAASGPFTIDGAVLDTAPVLTDQDGNADELGPKQGTATKIGVIHTAPTPMLAYTKPNGGTDLSTVRIATAKGAGGDNPATQADESQEQHDWLYFGWTRQQATGSSLIAIEFMQDPAPAACGNYTGANVVNECNPWANRKSGDFMVVWDQNGGSAKPVLRTWTGTAPNLTLGAPQTLTSWQMEAAYGNNNKQGEAAIDLTATVFGGATTCRAFANVIPSTITGNSDQADYKDTILTGSRTISNCGSVTIRKQTDDGSSTSFAFTDDLNSVDSTGSFNLADDGSKSFSNVFSGSYTVAESNSNTNYALDSIVCTASTLTNGSTITSRNTTTRELKFTLAPGDTIDCTFTNKLRLGALRIAKQSTLGTNPLVLNSGAVFSYNDNDNVADAVSVADNGSGSADEDSTVGEVCVDGLAPGVYTVNETTPPTGYGAASSAQADQQFTVLPGTDCADQVAGTPVSFTNAPLVDVQVNFRDQSGELGGTSLACTVITGSTASDTTVDTWTKSKTYTGIPVGSLPRTVTCTVQMGATPPAP